MFKYWGRGVIYEQLEINILELVRNYRQNIRASLKTMLTTRTFCSDSFIIQL